MDARIEKMNKLQTDVKSIFEAAKTAGRELTADEYTKKDAMIAEFNGLKKTLAAEAEAAAMHFERIIDPKAPRTESPDEAKVRDNFNAFLRTGEGRENFTITTGSGSGALLPVSVQTPVVVRRMWNAYINAAMVGGQPIIGGESTDTIILPVLDDSAVSGQATAEDASTDTAADPTVTSVSLGATLYDSKSLWFSNTQLKALPYDLSAYLMPILDKRIELSQNTAWHTKALTYQAVGNTITTAASNGITYQEFAAWYHKLGAQFRVDGVFIVSDGLLQVMESLTDNYGRPLLSDPLITGAVKTLRGCPVVIDTAMAIPAASAISGMFVSAASLHVRVCENRRIAVYKDVPTFPDQTGYRVFVNGDFGMSPGVAFLKHGVS